MSDDIMTDIFAIPKGVEPDFAKARAKILGMRDGEVLEAYFRAFGSDAEERKMMIDDDDSAREARDSMIEALEELEEGWDGKNAWYSKSELLGHAILVRTENLTESLGEIDIGLLEESGALTEAGFVDCASISTVE